MVGDELATDVLIIGSGIAGLTFALRVAEHEDVVLVTKKARLESNTNYAQGGIAAVIDEADSDERHVEDTLRAGAGLCHRERVETLVRSGPQAVSDLIDWGVRFSRSGGSLALGIEGGHSHKRIVHSRDQTGAAIEGALDRAVAIHPRVRVLEDHMALSLLVESGNGERRCLGAWVLDVDGCRARLVVSRATMLAAGGSAAIYRHTTNPAIATGDGVAMGYRAGAAIADMEFIQFHPTALYPAEEHAFLISEAVRGEGAVLRNGEGTAFMAHYDPRKDLAPRDIVARAEHNELKVSRQPHVWLDATGIPRERLEARFPRILEGCRAIGVDPRVDHIPVVPAAHYTCGGVWTDMEGRTTIPGLYAAGECACTGVHGANRLASNSLLEAVVFAERAAGRMVNELAEVPRVDRRPETAPPDLSGCDASLLTELRSGVKKVMWESFGIVRRHDEMVAGAEQLGRYALQSMALSDGSARGGDGARWSEAAETLNMLETAQLVARCALWRRESRGLHYVVDFTGKNNESFLRDSFVFGPRAPS